MAAIPKEIHLKVVSNLESVSTQLGAMSAKIARARHLLAEFDAQIIEIENDLKDCNVTLELVPIKEEEKGNV